jgi:glucuronate isomerase
MKNNPIVDDNFLLESPAAQSLYHVYASDNPIIDYHNHLPPKEVAENRQYDSISAVWLAGDHYKWRAMRTHGVDEHYITGKASDKEKFVKWAETVPYTMRNPLYHWTHLELSRYFGINELLNGDNAAAIYEHTNAALQAHDYSARGLLGKMNVEVICTTDDPLDDLNYHQAYAAEQLEMEMRPSYRPDKALLLDGDHYVDYIKQLGIITGASIETYDDLLTAMIDRIDYFHKHGCRVCDHGINQINYAEGSSSEIQQAITKALNGSSVTADEIAIYQSQLLVDLCHAYHQRGWVQQFHLGALRNNNKRMLATLGPDTGWDSIGDYEQARGLSGLLNRLDSTDQLTKTIIYNLNPRDNEVFASMIGNFNDGTVAGKVQWGSGWWFLDQLDGMEKQINTLSNIGLISHFIGMLTDSRSFLSFPRHEYFRRLLCNLFGEDIRRGLLPHDLPWIGDMIRDICYGNAKAYFPFEKQHLV